MKWLCVIYLCMLPSQSPLFAQGATTHNGFPSVEYRVEQADYIISLGELDGSKALIYEVGFQPSINHPWTKLGLIASGIATGSLEPGRQADAINEADAKSYSGKLYICQDRVAFVPANANAALAWKMNRSDFTVKFQAYGLLIKAVDKNSKVQRTGLVHFQPLSPETGNPLYPEPDEPKALHDRHAQDGAREFLRAMQGSFENFRDSYNTLAANLNVPSLQ